MSVIAGLMTHRHLSATTLDHGMSNCSSLQNLAFSMKVIDATNDYPMALNKNFDMIFNYFCLTHCIQSVISYHQCYLINMSQIHPLVSIVHVFMLTISH